MKAMVAESEQYLHSDFSSSGDGSSATGSTGTGSGTDSESVTNRSETASEMSSSYGKLKHSDSLLLLTQVRATKKQIQSSFHPWNFNDVSHNSMLFVRINYQLNHNYHI